MQGRSSRRFLVGQDRALYRVLSSLCMFIGRESGRDIRFMSPNDLVGRGIGSAKVWWLRMRVKVLITVVYLHAQC